MEIDVKAFARDLQALLKTYNVEIGAQIEGDLYGITLENFVVEDAKGNVAILKPYSCFISAHDLKDCV